LKGSHPIVQGGNMILHFQAASGLDQGPDALWNEDLTATGSAPLRSRWEPWALLCLAVTTAGSAQYAFPSLSVPDISESSTWTDYTELVQIARVPPSTAIPRSASEKLARIRANLSLNVTEMARVLKVERPTIYAWMRDDTVALRSENRLRLDRLHSLAKRWEERSTLPVARLLRDSNDAGESLLELLEAERFDDARNLLDALAQRGREAPSRRVPSVRESLEQYGLAHRIRRSQEEIDRISR
jgi:DNA-binding XRE family transcriptional regulator